MKQKGWYSLGAHVGAVRSRTARSPGAGISTFSRMWPTISSGASTTGVRYFSERLKAVTVSSKHSLTVDGTRAMISWSPWRPQRICIRSDWAGLVARPVLGPERCTLTTTSGTSPMVAMPRFSCMREKPGPLVAVKDFLPAREAPMMAPMLASSSSICMNMPPILGSCFEHTSAISDDGVMG